MKSKLFFKPNSQRAGAGKWNSLGLALPILFVLLILTGCSELQRLVMLGPENKPPQADFFIQSTNIKKGLTSAKIEWTAYTETDFVAYQVYITANVNTVAESQAVYTSFSTDTTSVTIENLSPSTNYYGQITVLRRGNTTLSSNLINFKTQGIALANTNNKFIFQKNDNIFVFGNDDLSNQTVIYKIAKANTAEISDYLLLKDTILGIKPYNNGLALSGILQSHYIDLSADTVTLNNTLTTNQVFIDFAVTTANIFALTSAYGLVSYSQTDFASIAELNQYKTAGLFTHIKLVDNYAFITNRYFGVQLFDITNPATPTMAASIDTAYEPIDLVSSSNILYILTRTEGIKIYDITDPAKPVYKNMLFLDDKTAFKMKISKNKLFVAQAATGIAVYDLTEPTSPVKDKTYLSYPVDFVLDDSSIYILDGKEGLIVATR